MSRRDKANFALLKNLSADFNAFFVMKSGRRVGTAEQGRLKVFAALPRLAPPPGHSEQDRSSVSKFIKIL